MQTGFPKRKRNRLPEVDYSASGAYFVTVCVSPRKNVFWQPDGKSVSESVGADIIRPLAPPSLTQAGKTVEQAILSISEHYPQVDLGCYCVMPDHIHLLLSIMPDEDGRMISAPTLSTVVGSMKRWVSRQLGRSIWQKSFFDRVIRTEKGYCGACRYIENNPAQWLDDHGDDGMAFDDEA